jgi:hypothetical protein
MRVAPRGSRRHARGSGRSKRWWMRSAPAGKKRVTTTDEMRIDLLVAVGLNGARHKSLVVGRLAVVVRRHVALARQTLSRSRDSSGRLAMVMRHALGGQIALVHTLGAVLARRAVVLVDLYTCLAGARSDGDGIAGKHRRGEDERAAYTFGLALPAADTGAAGPQRGAAHYVRHGYGGQYKTTGCCKEDKKQKGRTARTLGSRRMCVRPGRWLEEEEEEWEGGGRRRSRCRDFRSAEGNLLCEFPEEWSF